MRVLLSQAIRRRAAAAWPSRPSPGTLPWPRAGTRRPASASCTPCTAGPAGTRTGPTWASTSGRSWSDQRGTLQGAARASSSSRPGHGPERGQKILGRTPPRPSTAISSSSSTAGTGSSRRSPLRQARALRRFPIRRQRRLPRLHGRLPARQSAPTSASSPRRGPRTSSRPCTCFEAVKKGGTAAISRRPRRRCGSPSHAAARRPRRARPRCPRSLLRRRRLPAADEGIEDPRRRATTRWPGRRGRSWASRSINVPFAEVNEAWTAADKDESAGHRRPLAQDAAKVEGVTRETLETSAAMYLGQKAVLQEARGQRHHHQLPRRLLRRPHPRLSLPRLPRAQQRGPGRRPASATSARRRPWSR